MLLSLGKEEREKNSQRKRVKRSEIKYLSTYEAKQKRTKTSADSSCRTSKKNVKKKRKLL